MECVDSSGACLKSALQHWNAAMACNRGMQLEKVMVNKLRVKSISPHPACAGEKNATSSRMSGLRFFTSSRVRGCFFFHLIPRAGVKKQFASVVVFLGEISLKDASHETLYFSFFVFHTVFHLCCATLFSPLSATHAA